MAITGAAGTVRRAEVIGQHFTDFFPQRTAGASGNTLTLGASRVLEVRGLPNGATWSFSKPTLTLSGLTNTNVYDFEVDYI